MVDGARDPDADDYIHDSLYYPPVRGQEQVDAQACMRSADTGRGKWHWLGIKCLIQSHRAHPDLPSPKVSVIIHLPHCVGLATLQRATCSELYNPMVACTLETIHAGI